MRTSLDTMCVGVRITLDPVQSRVQQVVNKWYLTLLLLMENGHWLAGGG